MELCADKPQFDLTPLTAVGLRLERVCRPAVDTPPLKGSSHLRRFDEQAPKELQTTERVCSFIMATTLQSDHEGGETLSKNRRAGRSLLRVPPSGKRRPDYNLIRVERRNGAGASPPLVSGKCRRSTAASDHRCVQRSAHEKDLTRQAYLHKAGSHVRASAVQPTASPVARRVGSGGNKVNRTGGLQNG